EVLLSGWILLSSRCRSEPLLFRGSWYTWTELTRTWVRVGMPSSGVSRNLRLGIAKSSKSSGLWITAMMWDAVEGTGDLDRELGAGSLGRDIHRQGQAGAEHCGPPLGPDPRRQA